MVTDMLTVINFEVKPNKYEVDRISLLLKNKTTVVMCNIFIRQ
jgi:hypothetical protein